VAALVSVSTVDLSTPCLRRDHTFCAAPDVCACACHTAPAPPLEVVAEPACCDGHGMLSREVVCREHLPPLVRQWLEDGERYVRMFGRRDPSIGCAQSGRRIGMAGNHAPPCAALSSLPPDDTRPGHLHST
jgi:hypothetical protein